jgi:hypothetical protein
LGQGLGTILGLVAAFAIVFLVMTFGPFMPEDLIPQAIVNDFVGFTDLELKLAVVATILYPSAFGLSSVGALVGYGADGATVLMFLAWGTGGLLAGLASKDFLPGILAAVFATIIGAFLTWLLFFAISPGYEITGILDPGSLFLMEAALQGAIYPAIAATIGGLLGGGITRDR